MKSTYFINKIHWISSCNFIMILLAGALSLASGCKIDPEITGDLKPTQPVETPPKPVNTILANGVNLQPSYANNGNVNIGWNFMKKYNKIKSLRIEIEPDKVDQGKIWIQQALSNGYSVIATYHKSKILGSDDAAEVMNAANWWKTNYKYLSSNGDFTINMINEWGSHSISAKDFANTYNAAIAVVREVYKGKIVIDCPGYGQEMLTTAQAVNGMDGVKINDPDIILSAHIYKNGYNQGRKRKVIASDLDDLSATGKVCIIGEFGNQPADGPVDWVGVVNYAKSKGWSIYGWCWNGDGGVMNMINPSWYKDANPSTFTENGDYFNVIYDLL